MKPYNNQILKRVAIGQHKKREIQSVNTKKREIVTFSEFLSHVRVHHTLRKKPTRGRLLFFCYRRVKIIITLDI